MRLPYILKATVVAAFALCSVVQAAVIFDTGTTALVAGDPTQLGRLTRTGVASDWSTNKAFPGVTNPNTSVHYRTYLIDPLLFGAPFVQIDVDDPMAAIFVSAYLDSYNPDPLALNRGLDINYRGDDGSTGNPFTDPGFFQVVIPAGHKLVLVINDPSTNNAGLGKNFDVLVEGFADTQFTDPVPEPASILLGGAGLGCLALIRLRRKRTS
ncbi:MAG TPA: PEP-CTERM sorting domain-containing protein [Bryobacteraceae bacterium]